MKSKNFLLLLIFTGFLILCCYPLFLHLGNLSVRIWDEARNGINAMEMLKNHKFMVTYFDNQPDMWSTKPPFFIWMVALSMKIFGPTTFALRLPSVLSCLAIMIFSFWFCKRNLNSLWAGILSGLILATSVGFIDYHVARNGDFDAMLSMWMFFYAIQFYLYLENSKKINLVLFALFLALAILTKGIAGCMLLPGLFLIIFTNKKYISNLKSKDFYIIPVLGLCVAICYYFIRESINPGYISAVFENEITGRFNETNEGHIGTIWFYINLLKDVHYKYWIYFVPISFIFILVRGNTVLKKISLFLFVQALFYLIIITISRTKLPWYNAPLFPFFALIIGIGLVQVYIEIEKLHFIKKSIIKEIIFILFCALVFINPKKNILATSIQAKKETIYPECFYGDFINSVYNIFPQQKKLTIVSEGYNPHLLFYKKANEINGHKIEIIPSSSILQINDTILICETAMTPRLSADLRYDTLLFEDNIKLFMRVVSNSEIPKRNINLLILGKISEIKNNEEWLNGVVENSKRNKIDLEKQLILDAIYNLKELKKINQKEHDSLKISHNINI
ncbi:MAG: glycosyltransferase family 39 protein [Bacteroidetes bacterium]|nr:glycosyltransferase family 39 protein [Bacteroidota bacterium]